MLIIIWILFVHWFADFVCQTREQANLKSKSKAILFTHVFNYWLFLALFTFNPIVAFVNALTHYFIDYWTSRLTSKLYSENNIHGFFCVIGFDQFLHTTILIITYGWFHKIF